MLRFALPHVVAGFLLLLSSASAASGHGQNLLSWNSRKGVELVASSSSALSGRVPLSWKGGLRRGESAPLRLRGGGAGANAPKYPSNTALHSDEYHVPFGTILRSKSGINFAPTPTPKWFEDSIIYQIYPLGTPGRVGVEEGGGFFGEVPSTNDLTSEPQQRLQELEKFYDHLDSLGVTAIYFSPLFESETHGYDTVDYFKIDRRIGDNESFKIMLDELHKRGIRVILDGVFNHTGRKFHAFQELVDLGEKWETSQYKDWYFLTEGESSFGDKFAYRSWEGHEELPELNVENKDVREYLFSVGKFWLEMGVDGWRLDVAHELPPAFWRDFRTACSEANPEHVLLGEVIHGDYNTWVGPSKGLLHSGTNYQLSKAIWSSLRDKNFWELNTSLQRDLTLYRDMCLVNFLSNHDVARVATTLEQEPRMVFLAHFMLLTLRGVPCVYYGDEAAVRGRKEDGDASLRNKMFDIDGVWPAGGSDLYIYLKKLIALRAESPPLVCGSQTTLYFSNTEFIFMRQTDRGDTVVVAVNCDKEHAQIEVEMGVLNRPPGTRLVPIWGDGADCGSINKEYTIRIHIPPHTGRIFKVVNEEDMAKEATPAAVLLAKGGEEGVPAAAAAGEAGGAAKAAKEPVMMAI